ncbi:PilZ domain-containing protein [Desulfuromonas acetoxidans]|uniref:Type IV pilus assembly PilZ n=1 Tax=Desulfuromonas acetoxidans (strain DSM 684 / 11070) TaxID=281689 RepID=Q1JWD2_DESA6|nr:PilZ domain-containing protein [Desulfuromonas acetoxidans]EAT14551.1 type IV pilus assembly PilZ [Desulfuromonas acetoxidans DSM 684]MBF0645622.1 PilZ domain-containing protein [Desulfuromonas acetoxidans]NVD24327.1 PilZ domain-containing protein [Desulfuromonas acetoxidans]NVE14900.1 PilZ domain-containing protein [Desulfuromonas acetoxidans]
MEQEERRRDPRYNTLNFVYFSFQDPANGDGEYMGKTLDASLRGLLLEVHLPLPIGQRLNLSVGAGEDIFEFSGEVVHCMDHDGGMFCTGIEFDPMTVEKKEKLEQYLTAFAKEKEG